LKEYLEQVLQLEAVACKDWLTNKVDRSVTGRVATQQTCGSIQLPLNNVGVKALDFVSHKGVATAIGHAPGVALVDPVAGSTMAIAEALTNIVWAPLTHDLKGVSLSANWMWPSKNKGEDARLYDAVKAVSEFAIALGINIPTGKDSLSMTQKYPDGKVVMAPGTVIISAAAEVNDIRKTVTPALQPVTGTHIVYIDFSKDTFKLGGSSFAQILNLLGSEAPGVQDAAYFANAFNAVQKLVKDGNILAGHDISAGGMVTALLEMAFPTPDTGLSVDLSSWQEDPVRVLFSEKPGIVLQTANIKAVEEVLNAADIAFVRLGEVTGERALTVSTPEGTQRFEIDALRDVWFQTSFLLDSKQRPKPIAEERYANYKRQPLEYAFPATFKGKLSAFGVAPHRTKPSGLRAAIIREKGVNGD